MERVMLEVNEAKEIVLPQAVAEQMRPGAALVVESRQNGTLRVRVDVAASSTQKQVGPRLVKDGLATVVEGKAVDDFDWETFMDEEREAPMHKLTQ